MFLKELFENTEKSSIIENKSSVKLYWFNAATKQVIEVPRPEHHSSFVVKSPFKFGITQEELMDLLQTSQISPVFSENFMLAALKNNWIRVSLEKNKILNLQGINKRNVHIAAKHFFDEYPLLKQINIDITTDEVDPHYSGINSFTLQDDDVYFFIKYGKLPTKKVNEYNLPTYNFKQHIKYWFNPSTREEIKIPNPSDMHHVNYFIKLVMEGKIKNIDKDTFPFAHLYGKTSSDFVYSDKVIDFANENNWVRVSLLEDYELDVQGKNIDDVKKTVSYYVKKYNSFKHLVLFFKDSGETVDLMFDLTDITELRKAQHVLGLKMSMVGNKQVRENRENIIEEVFYELKFWYNPKTDNAIKIQYPDHHTSIIKNNPIDFGLDYEEVENVIQDPMLEGDYSSVLMNLLFSDGWIRASINKNTVGVQGVSKQDIKKAIKYFTSFYSNIDKVYADVVNMSDYVDPHYDGKRSFSLDKHEIDQFIK